ncbi:irregular chiasm C-roughest protein isoform X2 [Parasteatoda tepidariorum]|uniref:irregular chiasm C-roughest protein isoform X2 n=1 Tax=Parasteatoda tepidariorum TaxID=114398 RepID=UPI00077FAE28|nr:sialic acid-binding Ig-like lectin 14 isoform X2 [Parasteatoda tepidariorum]
MLPKELFLLGQLLTAIGCILQMVFCMEDSSLEKTIQVGESISIPCPLSTPGGSVQWLQNGAPIVLDLVSSKRRHWNISPDGTAALTIADARRSDAGRWDCRELGADGSVRKVAKVLDLVVGNSPSDPYLELEGRRLVHQATVTVREPQKLSIHCVVSGAIPPVRHIQWSIGEANLTSSSELFVEFSAEDDAYTSRSVLALNVTRRVHNKELICRVHHVSWLQAAAVSASLNVLYDPSFSISREPGFGFPLMERMKVSLRCEVDANPPSEPVWVKDDGPLSVQQDKLGYLNFTSIGHEHAGWYRCTTNHEFGTFASFGYFLNVRTLDLPVSTASGSNIPAGLGQSVNLKCISDGRPEVTAVNKSLMAIAGRSALLAGQLCSTQKPLRVLWIVRRFVLRPGDIQHPYIAYNLTETEIPNCYMSGLELRRVEVEDSGEVLLIVKNVNGIADAHFLLNITQASSFSSSSSASSSLDFSMYYLVAFISTFYLSWLQHSLILKFR